MAIPHDGLGAEQVQQLEAYEAAAKVLQDPAMATYVNMEALKQAMEEALGAAFDGAVASLAGEQAKLKEFVEAVKTEASSHGLNSIEAKVQAEEARIGASGAGTGAGTGTGPSGNGAGSESEQRAEPQPEHHQEPEPEHHEEPEHESEGGSEDGSSEEYA